MVNYLIDHAKLLFHFVQWEWYSGLLHETRSFWWYYHRKWMEFDHSCARVKFDYFFMMEKVSC